MKQLGAAVLDLYDRRVPTGFRENRFMKQARYQAQEHPIRTVIALAMVPWVIIGLGLGVAAGIKYVRSGR